MNTIDAHVHDGLCVGHDWRQCHARAPWDPDSTEAQIRRRLRETQKERPEWQPAREEVK
jgi:hypothetical protein